MSNPAPSRITQLYPEATLEHIRLSPGLWFSLKQSGLSRRDSDDVFHALIIAFKHGILAQNSLKQPISGGVRT